MRERLLTALDLWLYLEPTAPVRDVLRAIDPDPYREAIRDSVAAGDGARQAELAGRPAALEQPHWFAAVLGLNRAVAVERRQVVLEAALRTRPGDLGLLMELGESYPIDQEEGAAERARWYQAAVAAHPLSVAAHSSLGLALNDKGDQDGAVACYKEAIRLDHKVASTHHNLGAALWAKGDRSGAVACYREAVRLDPKQARSHNNLGASLAYEGNWDEAVAALKEALRLEPKDIEVHYNLGGALLAKGDLDGAVTCFREAVSLDPKEADVRYNLRRAESLRHALPRLADVLAGRDAPKTPAEGCTFALLCHQPFQKRFAAAARLYEKAFAGDAKLADDLTAWHPYNAACAAALAGRGDGVDAPADPAGRIALRAKAMGWLRADLALHNKQAASDDPAQRQATAARLEHWLADRDLAGLRQGQGRIGMPAAERGEWDALWADVRATLAEARKQPSREPKKP